jgi:methylase of polypeptide subunit release factors
MRFDISIGEARGRTLDAVRAAGFNPMDIDVLITDALHFAKHTAVQRAVLSEASLLEQQWYDSVARGHPDYSVYDTPWYVAESFACWYVYSRHYLKLCEKAQIFDSLDVRSVVDLGCGIGLTTAACATRCNIVWRKYSPVNHAFTLPRKSANMLT